MVSEWHGRPRSPDPGCHDRGRDRRGRLVSVAELGSRTDGFVRIRPPAPGESEVLRAGRDDAFYRWIGPGAKTPAPVACIVVEERLVGWIDYDTDHHWLRDGQVNVGYNVFAPDRGHGYASRALELLMDHLGEETQYDTVTLLIAADNEASLAVAARCGFTSVGEIEGSRYFERGVHRDG